MAEPALTLRDHPQIIDLISVLEQNGLQKAEGRSAGPGGLYRRYGRKAVSDDGRNEGNAPGGGQAPRQRESAPGAPSLWTLWRVKSARPK